MGDANDCEDFAEAVEKVLATTDRPCLIRVRSVIGFGAPGMQGTSKIHSDPLGVDEVRLTKRALGWPEDAQFLVPDGVRGRFDDTLGARGRKARADWEALVKRYAEAEPQLAEELRRLRAGEPPAGWDAAIPVFAPDAKGMASREASGKVLNAVAPNYPWLLGGSADLAGSNKTRLDGDGDFQPGGYGGRNLHYGVREHAMGSISNGLALSGLRPYTGTFLIFSDYMRPPTRLAALMEVPVVFIFTHDSIGLGQDGPTHQPVETVSALRLIPGLDVIRPADPEETAGAFAAALERIEGPTLIALTRQAVPILNDIPPHVRRAGVLKGGYVAAPESAPLTHILLGSGSELQHALAAAKVLGPGTRVVSMPSFERFNRQPAEYREAILPAACRKRVAIEAGVTPLWREYVGLDGAVIGIDRFGLSAPGGTVMKELGITADAVVAAARTL